VSKKYISYLHEWDRRLKKTVNSPREDIPAHRELHTSCSALATAAKAAPELAWVSSSKNNLSLSQQLVKGYVHWECVQH
jgi:hypothetical protein